MKMALAMIALLTTRTLFAQDDIEMTSDKSSAAAEPALLFQFEGAKDAPSWKAVNDGVMGGLSQGGPELKEGHLVFSGKLSLENNGGFSSVRTSDGPWNLKGMEGMRLRVMGDGRTYNLRIGTEARYRGSRIAYQAKFPTTKGEWTQVAVPFASLSPSYRGSALNGPPLDLSQVAEIGIILADKNEGPFEIKIDWIKAYSAESAGG